ncbi:MAG: hypothetical protein H6722_07940 [Sandaracinus sp.]|nr:hypothetical protein [Sandaracinus sp.]MCB9612365.1 hypothetical protein [Sandaracinus sp.]MCB9624224.1 hypothetical protein [Sandaracinus sp.]
MRVPARFDAPALLLWGVAALAAIGLVLWDASDTPPPTTPDAGPHFYDVAEIEAIYGLSPLDAGVDAAP